MNETIQFLAAPFCLALLLVLIHSYLGLHIIERDVIFVDISLSQVAALGAALSQIIFHEDSLKSLLLSLVLCSLASVGFAIFRKIEKNISQETLIGITYALASGFLVLALEKSPQGAEHLKASLIGNLLFTTWPQVFVVAVVYSFVGLIHYFLRAQFWKSTRGQAHSVIVDLLFYLLFSLVITFSTHHAGVLVVFSALVVPAALATKWGGSLRRRLFSAWSFGISALLIAFAVSFQLDWPLGAGIVVLFGMLFFTIVSASAYQKGFEKISS